MEGEIAGTTLAVLHECWGSFSPNAASTSSLIFLTRLANSPLPPNSSSIWKIAWGPILSIACPLFRKSPRQSGPSSLIFLQFRV